MSTVDLDAILSIDETNAPHTITFRGEQWLLPVDIPLETAKVTTAVETVEILLEEGAPGQLERFYALRPRPTTRDLVAIEQAARTLYGVSVGESSASPAPSKNTGERARPTSSASTTSTSAKRGRSASAR